MYLSRCSCMHSFGTTDGTTRDRCIRYCPRRRGRSAPPRRHARPRPTSAPRARHTTHAQDLPRALAHLSALALQPASPLLFPLPAELGRSLLVAGAVTHGVVASPP